MMDISNLVKQDGVLASMQRALDMMDVIVNKEGVDENSWELRYCKNTDMLVCLKKLEDNTDVKITKNDSDVYVAKYVDKKETPVVRFDISRVLSKEERDLLCKPGYRCVKDMVEVPQDSLQKYLAILDDDDDFLNIVATKQSETLYTVKSITVDSSVVDDLTGVLGSLAVD